MDLKAKDRFFRVVSWNARTVQFKNHSGVECLKTNWIARALNPEVVLLQEVFAEFSEK